MTPSFNPHIGNILQVYAKADRIDLEDGKQAYQNYHQTLQGIAQNYGLPAHQIIGAFAALSPNNSYSGNLRDLHTCCTALVGGLDIAQQTVTTYKKNRDKACRILQSTDDPLNILGGKKVRSFYQNILDPSDPQPITIDGHMYSVWMLKRHNMDDAQVGSGKKYDLIAADFRQVARVLGLLPNQLQAICWLTWKRLHGILSGSMQLGLQFEE